MADKNLDDMLDESYTVSTLDEKLKKKAIDSAFSDAINDLTTDYLASSTYKSQKILISVDPRRPGDA